MVSFKKRAHRVPKEGEMGTPKKRKCSASSTRTLTYKGDAPVPAQRFHMKEKGRVGGGKNGGTSSAMRKLAETSLRKGQNLIEKRDHFSRELRRGGEHILYYKKNDDDSFERQSKPLGWAATEEKEWGSNRERFNALQDEKGEVHAGAGCQRLVLELEKRESGSLRARKSAILKTK